MSEGQIQESEEKLKKRKALQMLIDDGDGTSGDDDDDKFEANINDERFKAVIDEAAFGLDPTHKDFHKMKGSKYLSKKRKIY